MLKRIKDRIVALWKKYRNFIIVAVLFSLFGAFILNPIWTYLSR